MSQQRAVYIYTDELEKYSYPESCPFSSRRPGITREIISSMGLLSADDVSELAPVPASRVELEKFHIPAYLDAIIAAEQGDLNEYAFMRGLGSEDCPIFRGMFEYAALSAGGTLHAAKLISEGKTRIAFNSSGGFHHAGAERAGGFCYLNDVVLGCLALKEQGMKVLFLDIDAHHCDGVQEAFYEESEIMTISLHQDGKTIFPGTGFEDEIGAGDGRGYTVNLPLPVGTYDEAYMKAFREIVLPLAHKFNPDVFVVEIGMDALAGDPLTHLSLTNNAYADVLELILAFGKPILATGGGGYNIDNTTRGWALAWSIFSGENEHADMTLGLGGVMLESTEWQGGLRDRVLVPGNAVKTEVDSALSKSVEKLKNLLFPLHKI